MQRHYSYFMSLFPGDVGASLEKFLFAIALGLVLILLGARAAARIGSVGQRRSLVVPEGRFSLFAFFDVFMEGFTAFHDSILGKENRRHIPLTASVFLFVFFANILGLVPGFPAITTTIWVDLAMAVVVFTAFNLYGIRAHGVVGYLKHFFASPELLRFPSFMFIIGLGVFLCEVISTLLRILTLNLRLYWNITADHLVLSVITQLLPWGAPVLFFLMGTFVAFMQAFVFTILTMIYILLATQHGEEGH